MSINLHPDIEARLRAAAATQGVTVEAYLARLIQEDQSIGSELEALAREGANSGEPLAPGPDYWKEKHRRLDSRFKNSHKQ